MSGATHCSRCGDLIAANSSYISAVVVGYYCSLACRDSAEAAPGRHNPFAASARNREQAVTDVVEDDNSPTSVAATFANRLRAAARRFDGLHSRPDLEVEHLTSAECEQLATELVRLDVIDSMLAECAR